MYFVFIDRLSKLTSNYNRDLTLDEIQKSKKDAFAFGGDNCVEKALDFCLKIKGEERKNKKIKFSNIIFNCVHTMDKFNEYRDIDVDEMNGYINEKLGELPIRKLLQKLSLNDLLWDFEAVSLYPSAMSDDMSIYQRIEGGLAYTKDMNDELVEKFNNQSFTQGSAILKIKYYNPKFFIVQHLPVKEREKKMEINRT